MAFSHVSLPSCQWFAQLASSLDKRSAPRLAALFLGAVIARGRRTVTSWIRAVQGGEQYHSYYTALAATGKNAQAIAIGLVLNVIKPLLGGSRRITLAIDDTPTSRYGPRVEGAGIHHNPTPGPTHDAHVYGHVFVVLALLLTHKAWGTHAFPLLARMYVRKTDLPKTPAPRRPVFQTKLEMAVASLKWAQR